MCDRLKLNLGSFCHFDDERLERVGSRYRSGHTRDWLKFKNPTAPAVKREAEEEWGKR